MHHGACDFKIIEIRIAAAGRCRRHAVEGRVAIAARKHANKNPFAMMGKKALDMPTYLAGRVIGYPRSEEHTSELQSH